MMLRRRNRRIDAVTLRRTGGVTPCPRKSDARLPYTGVLMATFRKGFSTNVRVALAGGTVRSADQQAKKSADP
jgi:hypothetical protein